MLENVSEIYIPVSFSFITPYVINFHKKILFPMLIKFCRIFYLLYSQNLSPHLLNIE